MANSQTLSRDLGENESQSVFTAGDWVELTVWHTADAVSGDCILSIGSSFAEDGTASVKLPLNEIVGPLRLAPGTEVAVISTAGRRRLNVIVSPVAYTQVLLERVAAAIDYLASCILGGRPDGT